MLSWAAVLLLLALFAFIPLCHVRENFDVMLFEKVGFKYAIMCLLLAGYAVIYALGEELSAIFITPALSLIVKIFAHLGLYARLKYHDDGHDYVSRI